MNEESTSEFVGKEACPACGSRDNLGRYSDGHGHCFGCGYYEKGEGGPHRPSSTRTQTKGNHTETLINPGEAQPLPKRSLTQDTLAKWGVGLTDFNNKRTLVLNYRDASGRIVAQKLRFPGKEFAFIGDTKQCGLFGQHLWRDKSSRIVITEGEIDAMSVSQAQNNKWPVVSVPNGAQGAKKALQKNLEYLMGFDEVVLMFDNDDAGRKATEECITLFRPGQCKVAKLPLKDANEMLMASRGKEIIDAIWGAKVLRPDGLIRVNDLKEKALQPVQMGLPWFLPTLTQYTYGRRFGEIHIFGAGTGVGKTDFLTEQIAYDVGVLKEKVGLFFLEQEPEETLKRVAGKVRSKLFHIPDDGWTREELSDALDILEADDKLSFYDHYGVADYNVIENHIRFLTHSEGCRIFYIDHLTALADPSSERESLETIMAALGGLVKELKILIHLVSHLSTPEGKSHEEGGRVTVKNFKGARAIGFWCPFMYGLERDQQADDPVIQKTTTFRILKDRNTGRGTGKVVHLLYDTATGRLAEHVDNPFDREAGTSDVGSPF